MTDQEFDVLDELYFLRSYQELFNDCQLKQEELKQVLQSLLEKGWLKCFKDRDKELTDEEIDFKNCFDQYFYLASKSGLFAHNSKI